MRMVLGYATLAVILASGTLGAEPMEAPLATKAESGQTMTEKRPVLTAGFFVDTYYAASAWIPKSRDRQYLTQIARDSEFNINLAHLEAQVEDSRLRGRLAVQFGTSVNANYQNETTNEKYSNQLSHRNLQEACVGYKLLDKLWLDAGIFFGNIGVESWISHANWNYTRALMAENTPYYATGARLTFAVNPALQLQILAMNGWQVITSTNKDKSLGTRIAWEITQKWKLTHSTFVGNVAPDDTTTQYRFYNNLILQFSPFSFLQFALSGDIGAQKNALNDGYRHWYTGALHARYLYGQQWSFAVRLEYMLDREQVLIRTGTENGFQVAGSTVTINYHPEEAVMLRMEYRNFFSRDSIFRFTDVNRPTDHILCLAMSLKI